MPWSKPAENKPVTYEQLSKEYQQRSINSPALGLDQSIEPSPIQSAASNVSASMKEGADKMASAIRPKPSASTESKSKKPWPFSKKDEVSAEFYVEIAQVYEQTDPEQAAAQYERALAINPKHLEAMLAYAHLADRTEKIEKAIELYQRAMSTYPKDPRAANDLGLCYARHERYDESLAYLNRAIKLKPDRELYRNNIATVLVKMGRTEEAVTQISAVYGEAVARYNVGLMLHNQGSREAATAEIVRALQIKPDLAQAQQWLAQLNQAGEQAQLAEARPSGYGPGPGPVAIAGGVDSAELNAIPQLATPTSAMIETARAPRALGVSPPNLMSPTPIQRSSQPSSSAAPPPPLQYIKQTCAILDDEGVEEEGEDEESSEVTQASLTVIASDEN